jgi:hypothetical protein
VKIATFNIDTVNKRLANLLDWLADAQSWRDAGGHPALAARRPNDKGMRLNPLLLSPALANRLAAAGVSRSGRGEEGASDHTPTWIMLEPSTTRKREAVGTSRPTARPPDRPTARPPDRPTARPAARRSIRRSFGTIGSAR